jgi:hypothetical protein
MSEVPGKTRFAARVLRLAICCAWLVTMAAVSACDMPSDAQVSEKPRDAGAVDGADGGGDAVVDSALPYGSAMCDRSTEERFAYYRDADGDGQGDSTSFRCASEDTPAGFSNNAYDCDDDDAQRGRDFYERFGDSIDSSCNGEDDPTTMLRPCLCQWHAASSLLDVQTDCDEGYFNLEEALPSLRDVPVGDAKCHGHVELVIAHVVQCHSICSDGPVYFMISNVGDKRSLPARVTLTGSFRLSPPEAPLIIEPLDPGEHTALIETTATGEFTLAVQSDDDECNELDNSLSLVVADYHCGFLP